MIFPSASLKNPLFILIGALWVFSAHAADSSWNEAAGGDFGTGGNWSDGVPGTTDMATFGLDDTYTVTFDDNFTNNRAVVSDGVVTFDLDEFTYTLTNTNTSNIGTDPVSLAVSGGDGETASLSMLSDGEDGTLSTVQTRIGHIDGGTGNVTVSDTIWNNSSILMVGGFNGTGSLLVNQGSEVTTERFFIGVQGTASTGSVHITGSGTTLTATGNTNLGGEHFSGIGPDQSGTLLVDEGAALNTVATFVAARAGATGLVTISGVGSTWTNSGILNVGPQEEGTVTLTNGATATVGGAMGIGGYVNVNQRGTGEVNITGGATLTTSAAVSVGLQGSTGTINISGAGSEWDGGNNDWTVGGWRDGVGGNATINITDGGVLSLRNFNTGAGVGATPGSTVVNIAIDGLGSELNVNFLGLTGNSTGTTTT